MDVDAPISAPIVHWRTRATVSRAFRLARYLARFILPFTPPPSLRKVRMMGWLAFLVALQIGLVIWVNINVAGSREVDVEVRVASYICLAITAILSLIPAPSGTADKKSRTLDFRGGVQERAAIVDDHYVVRRDVGWVGFRVARARRVHWLPGVVAVEMPGGKFAFLPLSLFPTKAEWDAMRASLPKNEPISSEPQL